VGEVAAGNGRQAVIVSAVQVRHQIKGLPGRCRRVALRRHAVRLGRRVRIDAGAVIETRQSGGRVSLGDDCWIHTGAMLLGYGGAIVLGDRCSVNPYSVLYGHGGLEIGNDVLIASHCVFIPGNHRFDLCDVPIRQQGLTALGIVVEDDVWFGTGVRVLDGCRVGTGSVVAAGAVVTKDIPPYVVAGGVPARVLRAR